MKSKDSKKQMNYLPIKTEIFLSDTKPKYDTDCIFMYQIL